MQRVLNSSGLYHGSAEADLLARVASQRIAEALIREIAFDTTNAVRSRVESTELRDLTIAANLRSLTLLKSVLLLAAGSFNEEMWCLLRPLVELAINTAYLLTAEEDELRRFLLYDELKSEELHKTFDWLEHRSGTPHGTFGAETSERQQRTKRAAEIRQTGLFDSLYRNGKINSWSRLDLFARAQKADSNSRASGASLFEIIQRTVTKEAHGYVHSNNTSLRAYRDCDELGTPLRDASRIREAEVVAATANAAVLALMTHTRVSLGINDHPHTARANGILKAAFGVV